MKKWGIWKRTAFNIAVTLIFGFVFFYAEIPAINLHNPGLYVFVILLSAVYCAVALFGNGMTRSATPREIIDGIKKSCRIPAYICVGLIVIFIIGHVISWPIFRAGAYQKLLPVETGNFTEDVTEISFDKIPLLDEESAIRLGDRKLGELADVVSQFEVSTVYTQINYKSRPIRVTYLEYGDFFKWLNNVSEGLPAYITVDMTTQETEVVRLSDGIKYSPSEYFNRDLDRYLRFSYPTYMFATPTFEIDDDGAPYWICSRISRTIGLFGGTDVVGVVLVNAVTGESSYYDVKDVPNWVDRVYLASLIIEQYDYHGTYINGWLNSIVGQKGVTVTSDGYNFIAMDDDVYMYTGITSVGNDESNVGFILTNQRTKETKYYAAAGATEYSAKDSAQGVVQDLGYSATFPLLLNISGQPTYFMALKDSTSLVKMYAMVNEQQYQIVATGATVAACEQEYVRLLVQNNVIAESDAEGVVVSSNESGIVDDIRSAVIDGNTYYYIRLLNDAYYYRVSAVESEAAVIINVGDNVSVQYSQTEGDIREAKSLELK
ncbi:MAG: CvpA family protein [Clostridia bacterium]|nr:CvpA family protein [Clostridia bacterium]